MIPSSIQDNLMTSSSLTNTFQFLLSKNLVIHVVGNKSDLASSRAVSKQRTEEYVARALGLEHPVNEVSAKDDEGNIPGVLSRS